MILPTFVEPVNDISFTRGSSYKTCAIVAPSPGTTLKIPAGALHRSMISASFNPTNDVSSEGFSTTVFPQASAKATFFIDNTTGKLNGEIAPTTPSGRRIAIEIIPGTSDGNVSPR